MIWSETYTLTWVSGRTETKTYSSATNTLAIETLSASSPHSMGLGDAVSAKACSLSQKEYLKAKHDYAQQWGGVNKGTQSFIRSVEPS